MSLRTWCSIRFPKKTNRVRSKQVILLACGVVLVIVLFAFANIKPPQKEDQLTNSVMAGSAGTEAVDFSVILEKAKSTLPGPQLDSVSTIELQLKKVRGDLEK